MIDTSTFKYEETRLKDVYSALKRNGINVYFPSVKVGDCTDKYVVVGDAGTAKHADFSSDVSILNITLFVPIQKYAEIASYTKEVRNAMKDLRPMILYNGIETPAIFDENIKAYNKIIQYKFYSKLD